MSLIVGCHKDYDPSKPVKLIACFAGSKNYAKELAKELGNTVIASTTQVDRIHIINPFTGQPMFVLWDKGEWQPFCP